MTSVKSSSERIRGLLARCEAEVLVHRQNLLKIVLTGTETRVTRGCQTRASRRPTRVQLSHAEPMSQRASKNHKYWLIRFSRYSCRPDSFESNWCLARTYFSSVLKFVPFSISAPMPLS